MRALAGPAAKVHADGDVVDNRVADRDDLEAGVGRDQIGAAGGNAHFHVVHQTLAHTEEVDLQIVIDGGVDRFTDGIGDFDGGPDTFVGFVAVGPVGGLAVVAAVVAQFEAAASAIGPLAPAPAGVAVSDLVDDDEDGVGHRQTTVGHDVQFRHRQRDALAAVGQGALVIADGVGRRQIPVAGQEVGEVLRDDEILAVGEYRIFWNRIVDAVQETPTAKVYGSGAAIVELDVLVIVIAGNGAVHDFVDHDRIVARRAVGRARRARRHAVPRPGAVGPPAHGNAVALGFVRDGIDHAGLVRVHQVNAFARGAEERKPRAGITVGFAKR